MATIHDSRVYALDGLRGLAALSVFFSHVAGLVPNFAESAVSHSILHIFWDGASAVTLFFALSGYVLSLPFTGTAPKRLSLSGFLLTRLTRLYPAYWFALVISIELRHLVLQNNNLAMLSPWAASLWASPITPGTLVRHFFMVAPAINTTTIDPVIWSLVVEMKMSLIFPAIIFLVQRTSKPLYALPILSALVVLSLSFSRLGVPTLFVEASYLANFGAELVAWALRLSITSKVALLAVALVGYENVWIVGDWGRRSGFVVGAGALLLILLTIALKPLSRLTTLSPSRFLGDVSYSFYLLHLPILLAVSSAVYPRFHSVVLCAAISLVIAVAASKIAFECIERPIQRYGKTLAGRLSVLLGSSIAPASVTS